MNDDATTSDTDDRRRRATLRLSALGVAAATLALMLATAPRLAIVWDEGYTLGRENRIRLWFRALRDPAGFARTWTPPALELVQVDERMPPPPRPDQVDTRAELFGRPVLLWFWPFAREEPHGHPPFYALVGLVGDLVVPGWPELDRARFGPILAFSLTAGALFGFVARRWGPWAGAAAAGAFVLQPNLFGHGHYAAYDALLTCLWVDALLAFWLAVEPDASGWRRRPRWGWAIAFGVLLGWAADTKLTGWFLPVPFVGWAILHGLAERFVRGRTPRSPGEASSSLPSPLAGEDRVRGSSLAPGTSAPHPSPPPQGGRGPDGGAGDSPWRPILQAALVAAPVALLTLYLFNPAWWLDPIGGVERFLRSNLTRGQTIPIAVRFLGRTYDTPRESLPWYNTIAWTILVTPVGFLTLALVGMGRAVRRWREEPFGLLALIHWYVLMALRALPHTPGHDGVRLFLPAFGVLAILAGLGAASLVGHWRRVGRVLVAAALLEGAGSVAAMMPVPLSYFSPLVGGLPGATRLGMEPTYYWDALSDEAIDWLNAHTPPGRRVRFPTFPTSFLYLKRTGRLSAPLAPIDPGVDAWVVIQNRPGIMSPRERAMTAGMEGRAPFVASKFGTPLLWIFPMIPPAPRP